MDPKVVNYVLIGWDENTKGYQFYNPSSKKVFITQHVKVDESEMPIQTTTESVSTFDLKWTIHTTFFHFAITTSIDLLPKVPFSYMWIKVFLKFKTHHHN
jgi:hypothetical protein